MAVSVYLLSTLHENDDKTSFLSDLLTSLQELRKGMQCSKVGM